jgi:serine/threonine protein phosphatase PrpC
MTKSNTCPKCGKANRSGAKFCQNCGNPLAPDASPASISGKDVEISRQGKQKPPKKPSFFSRIGHGLDRIDQGVDDMWKGLTGQGKEVPIKTTSPLTGTPVGTPANAGVTTRLSQLPTPKPVGDIIGSYRVLQVYPLHRSNYYQVLSLQCEQGHLNSPSVGDTCPTCHTRLPLHLMHETIPMGANPGNRPALVELSGGNPPAEVAGILRHYHIFDVAERQYTVTIYPSGTRQSLPVVRLLPAGSEAALNWCVNLAKALAFLHQHGYAFTSDEAPNDFLEPVVVIDGQMACFADLTSCVSLKVAGTDAIQRDIVYIGRLLYSLTTGDRQNILQPSARMEVASAPLRHLISRIRQRDYPHMNAVLEDMLHAPPPEAMRSLRQNAGYRTDLGRTRDHNEDFVGRYSFALGQSPDAPDVGLYIVADGMGGHESGELASQDVVKAVVEHIQENLNTLQAAPKLKRSTVRLENVITPGEVLQQAIQRANQALYNVRRSIGADRGTTITAALVVGDTCAIANVGDSRTYLYRGGVLSQLTRDHSLVASMVAAGMLKPEEVRSHPQRNQIFRQLGDKPNVEIDIFAATLTAGDRLLLCCDGLWEMVPDPHIQQVLQHSSSPQAACDQLVSLANQAGGEDNISVIVVSIE